jgi:quercetin dioxygenase-like cupin family protein
MRHPAVDDSLHHVTPGKEEFVRPADLKRVVTGSRDGKSEIESITPCGRVVKAPEHDLDHWATCQWISGAPHRIDEADLSPTWLDREPPPGGSAFRLFQFPPAGAPGAQGEMHTTHTVDYIVIISGQLWLILDDGEVELNVGDTVVQRGVAHRWENRADVPCFAASVMIGAAPPAAR